MYEYEYCLYEEECHKDKCDYDCEHFDYHSAVNDEILEWYYSER